MKYSDCFTQNKKHFLISIYLEYNSSIFDSGLFARMLSFSVWPFNCFCLIWFWLSWVSKSAIMISQFLSFLGDVDPFCVINFFYLLLHTISFTSCPTQFLLPPALHCLGSLYISLLSIMVPYFFYKKKMGHPEISLDREKNQGIWDSYLSSWWWMQFR